MRYLLLGLLLPALTAHAMHDLSDEELEAVDGRMAIVLSNVFIDAGARSSADHGSFWMAADPFNYSEVSEIRLYKSGASSTTGFSIGTDADPIRLDIRAPGGAQTEGMWVDMPTSTSSIDAIAGHFRVDSVREADFISCLCGSPAYVFDSEVSITGLQLLPGTKFGMWGRPYVNSNDRGGLALASVVNLDAAQIDVQTVSPDLNPTATQVRDASLQVRDIKVRNLYTGTEKQPLVFRSYTDGGERHQISFEILPVTASNKTAPAADVTIKGITFGYQDFDGNAATNEANFQPSTAQAATMMNGLPLDSVVRIKGLEIQHLRITTQDI